MNYSSCHLEVICSLRASAATTRRHEAGPPRLKGLARTVDFIFLVACIAAPLLAQPRPLVEYRFEEGSGKTVANTGLFSGAIGVLQDGMPAENGPAFSRDAPQRTGSAYSLRFDGRGDLVRIPDAFNYTVDGMPSSTPLSQLTIEAWIKPNTVGGGTRMAIWDDNSNPGVYLGLWDDQVAFTISTSSDPGVGVTNYSGKIVAGVWQHVAAVYDGEQVKIYVDGQDTGVSVATSGAIQDNSYVNQARASINIGAESDTLSANFDGFIDELRVVPVVLTPDQLAGGLFADRSGASGVLYSLHDRGGVSLAASGTSADASAGYARVEPTGDSPAPVGTAILGYRQGGILVTQAGVQASGLIRSGRIPVSIGDSLDTGIAIANPFTQEVTIDFYLTDQNGATLRSGTTVIPPFSQIARFLTQAPFASGSPVQGTFTFTASGPVAAIALRGLLNERDEFLITTLPIVDITSPGKDPVVIPHFADGDGWTTEILLVNRGDTTCEGTLQFYDQGNETTPGRAISMSIDGIAGTSFDYSIPGRSAKRMKASSSGLSPMDPGSSLKVGSVLVTPNADNYAPTAIVVFSHKSGGVTDTEAGVSSVPPSTAFRMYVESSGLFGAPGSMQSGFGLSNPSSEPVSVNLELTTMNGEPTGLSMSMDLPARGQKSLFLNQIDGFRALPNRFQGQLRISTHAASGLAVTGLAGSFNERGDFLLTTTPAADETSPPSTKEVVFPQIVEGGGYTTQLILVNAAPGQDPSGRVRFFSSAGAPMDLSLR
jgi:hypothetical protein